MDIVNTLEESQTVLILMPSSDYVKVTKEIAKKLSKKKVLYVTLNKTVESLKEDFKKGKIKLDNFYFIDGISKTLKKVGPVDDCHYLTSPAALTELSIAISKALKYEFDYIIFDSITNMLTYSSKSPITRFLYSIVNKLRDTNTKAIFYAINLLDHAQTIQESSIVMDEVIDLTKK